MGSLRSHSNRSGPGALGDGVAREARGQAIVPVPTEEEQDRMLHGVVAASFSQFIAMLGAKQQPLEGAGGIRVIAAFSHADSLRGSAGEVSGEASAHGWKLRMLWF